MRFAHRRWLRALLVGSCLWLAACGARRKVEGDLVRTIKFDVPDRGGLPVLRWFGIYAYSGQTNYQLRGAMEQDKSSFGSTTFPLSLFATGVDLDPVALDRDAWRLEVWYAHHGWFDAEFGGWEVIQVRPRARQRAGVVVVRGHLTHGEPSLIRTLVVTGMDDDGVSTFRNTAIARSLAREGVQFDLAAVRQTREQLLALLADHGFPYATAEMSIDAYPEEHAVDVALDVDPGRLALFGPITVTGTDKVPEAYVRDALTMVPGHKYEHSELARSQQELFKFRTFSLVQVTPDLSDPTVKEVPVAVSVTETSFRSLRAGGGVEYENATLTPRLTGGFEHTNVLRRLIQFKAEGSAGLAFSSRRREPTWSVSSSISSPRLAHGKIGVSTSASVTRDFQQGQFAYFNPKARADFVYKPSAAVSVGAGTSLELYRFVDFSGAAQSAARVLFGRNFENPYRLIKVQGTATFDWRDDPLFTTRGSYYSLGVKQALPVLGAHFLYTEVTGDLRRYIRPRNREFTLAFRIAGRAIQPWNRFGVPYPERAFLGGSSSLRGFQANQVGPYDLLCVYEPSQDGDPFTGEPGAGLEVTRNPLPRGGLFSLTTQVEFRIGFASYPELTVVPFVDAGVLAPSLLETRPSHLRYGAGIGARYASLIGPIRVDFALRPTFPEDDGPEEVVDCLTDDVQFRTFDFPGVFSQKLRDGSQRPLAFNVYLTIGEAF